MEQQPVTREQLKFKWSHTTWWHRAIVRAANRVLFVLPFGLKYGVGRRMRADQLPYMLLKDMRAVVQVGAPMDTLKAGRSRGMYFAMFAPPTARVLIVEPDPESVAEFRSIVQRLGLTNVTVHQGGAWSEQKLLKLYVDPNHPASNFTEGTVNYSDERLKSYRVVEIPVNTVDNLLAQYGITPDLISVTTNGSEREILQGMQGAMQNGLKYVALARTGQGYNELMDSYGYKFYGHDDRGYTYTRAK